ncbi:ATP-binding protein [Streptomyces sp. NPDC048361]|uniref:ATP-binding protein n=1 Tax=Streptomyces sp. NPDC048361 TaxID=3154720 RepID=UPI00343BEC84
MTETETTQPPIANRIVLADDTFAGVSRARDAARAFVEGLIPAPEPEKGETLALVVSELTTNALRHGGGRYTLRLQATADWVDVAVSDVSPMLPRERTPDLHGGAGGFGWHMIRRLVSDISVTPTPRQGKIIRARLPR